MTNKTLDYIIVIVILIITIVVIMKILGVSLNLENMGAIVNNEKNNNFNTYKDNNIQPYQYNQLYQPQYFEYQPSDSIYDSSMGSSINSVGSSLTESALGLNNKNIIPTSESVSNNLTDLKNTYVKSTETCPLNGTNYDNDKYIKEFVLMGKFDCADKTTENYYTKTDIVDYQNKMLDLNDTINGTSAGVGVIDKINELYLSKNNESLGYKGQTIADVYNGLTQTMIDKYKQCKNTNCLIPPQFDDISKTAYYTVDAQFGKSFRNGLMLETDEVSNGSKFYHDVEGFDNDFENNSAI
jgi:hypothetical protein